MPVNVKSLAVTLPSAEILLIDKLFASILPLVSILPPIFKLPAILAEVVAVILVNAPELGGSARQHPRCPASAGIPGPGGTHHGAAA